MADQRSELVNLSGNGRAGSDICDSCGTPRDAATVAAHRLRLLSDIGLALSAERDIHRLLDLILTKARDLTGADAGSIYTVHEEPDGLASDSINLHFRAAQNDSKSELNTKVTFPVGASSLAGYAALRGETLCFDDAYRLPSDAPYRFNPDFDRKHNYRTKSVLVVPLKNHIGEVIGVLQLINRKRDPQMSLADGEGVVTEEMAEREVVPFDNERAELAATLASQAAVALENNQLLQKIEALFESFVTAAASAIEDRDPTTSGHSLRVTAMTLALAEAATEATGGPFADVYFSPRELKELRYAGLLHDFGKIGVRENILIKSHKIDPGYFEAIKDRLVLLAREREKHCADKKIAALLDLPREEAILVMRQCDEDLKHELAEIQEEVRLLTQINDPVINYVPDEDYARQLMVLNKLANTTYANESGESRPILSPEEHQTLSVRRGSLTPYEYKQIQRHAQLSFEFLQRISWTSEFSSVPELAYCHHEKLNGTGYPRGITAEQIPLRARMMTVADIFDALTASDRPYKKAMPADRALQILELEARNGLLDPDVVELFIERAVYRVVEEMQPQVFHGQSGTS
jgi:HD-GYP domain-containing protein (c-di-GMP phosphodiesterase class II)